MAEKAQAVDRILDSGNWLPEIVHLHLTALEAGWLTAVLHCGKINDVAVNVRGPNGDKVSSTMCRAIGDKVRTAWENHD
jgi:hypothetical protein